MIRKLATQEILWIVDELNNNPHEFESIGMKKLSYQKKFGNNSFKLCFNTGLGSHEVFLTTINDTTIDKEIFLNIWDQWFLNRAFKKYFANQEKEKKDWDLNKIHRIINQGESKGGSDGNTQKQSTL